MKFRYEKRQYERRTRTIFRIHPTVLLNYATHTSDAFPPRLFQAILSPSHSELFESNGPVCCIQSSDHMKHREAGASLEQLWRGTADSNKGSVN